MIRDICNPRILLKVSMKYYSYEELLERALSKLPQKPREYRTRTTPPQLQVVISGKRTFIHNFRQICNLLNRNPRHLARFILRELAAPGYIEENQTLVIQGEIPITTLAQLLRRYMKIYVICPVCNSPDTILVKERRMFFIVCQACGAKSSAPPII